jgi:hypothetical protein
VVGGIVLAFYSAGRITHIECVKLAEKLKAKLWICRVAEQLDDRWRIRVRNLADRSVRFSAKLERISPAIPYHVPAFLQVTGTPPPYREADIPGNGDALIDLCMGRFDPELKHMALVSAEHPAGDVLIPRNRYTILVSAFPLAPGDGGAARRWFYIIPQPDGTLILSDGGSLDDYDPPPPPGPTSGSTPGR